MGSIKEPNLKMPWKFMIIFGICVVGMLIFIPEPYATVLAIMCGLSARRLGNAWPKFYGDSKISLNNWLTK